jgi:hypothetical protein
MRQILTFAIITISCSLCIGQTYSTADFIETPLPKEYSEELRALNYSKFEFKVQLVNGKLSITNPMPEGKIKPHGKIEYDIPTGKLIGTNYGEWGGGIYYQPKNESQKIIYINQRPDTATNKLIKSKVIYVGTPLNKSVKNTHLVAGGNIVGIFSVDNTICYVEGLAHLSYNAGAVSKVSVSGTHIDTEQLLEFNSAPFAYALYNNKIYIAAFNNFYVIADWKKEKTFDNIFWSGLYPNSIAVKDENNVYVGMRGGYALLDPMKKTVVFYKYKL